MAPKRYDSLEKALVELNSGQDLEEVLKEYPGLRAELEAAQLAKSISQPEFPPDIENRNRTRLLKHAKQLRKGNKWSAVFISRIPRFVIALIVLAIFLLSGGGLFAASAKAVPGDQLYNLKRTFETVRLGLTINPDSHELIEEQYRSRRIDEVQRLHALERIEMVEFYGVVEEQQTGKWTIGSVLVKLTPETIIIGDIFPGMTVEVEGVTQPEGWVLASEIHLQSFAFIGDVQSISNNIWLISGRDVLVTSESKVASDIAVGDLVVVLVQSDDLGTLTAMSVMHYESMDDNGKSSEVTPPPEVDELDDIEDEDDITMTATSTPEPEETDTIDETDEPDETREPEETEDADETDEADETDDDHESEDSED